MPSREAEAEVVLSNTTDAPLSVTARLARRPHHSGAAQAFELAPHQTRALDLRRDFPDGEAFARAEVVALSLEHAGAKSALLARAMVSDDATGYSNVVQFSNPGGGKSSEYQGVGFRVDEVGGERLAPVIVARNVGAGETTIKATWTDYRYDTRFVPCWYYEEGQPAPNCNDCNNPEGVSPAPTAQLRVRPRITSITPARGLVGSTIPVTINGRGFRPGQTTVSASSGINVNVNSASSTQLQTSFNISADAPGANHAVMVTSRGRTSNSVNFYVQTPFAVTAVSVSPADGGCDPGTVGYGAQVLYQVVDNENQPIAKAGMTPEEVFTVFFNGVALGGQSVYAPFATPPTTNGLGRFLDIPIVTCSNAPGTNPCFDVQQEFRIKVPTSSGERLYFLPTVATRRDCKLGMRVKVTTGTATQTFSLGTVN